MGKYDKDGNWVGWCVVTGLTGAYMQEVSHYATKHDAERAAMEEKEVLLESGFTVHGDIRRDGFYSYHDDTFRVRVEPCSVPADEVAMLRKVGEWLDD